LELNQEEKESLSLKLKTKRHESTESVVAAETMSLKIRSVDQTRGSQSKKPVLESEREGQGARFDNQRPVSPIVVGPKTVKEHYLANSNQNNGTFDSTKDDPKSRRDFKRVSTDRENVS
jgi:hypothetical protein